MSPTPEARRRREKTWTGLLALSILICAALVVMVGFTMKFALSGRNQSSEVRKSADAASCRAQFSAAVGDARQELDDARADLQVHQFDGEVAGLVLDNQAALEQAVAAGNKAKTKIKDARDDYRAANARYVNLLRVESDNKPLFLTLCKDPP